MLAEDSDLDFNLQAVDFCSRLDFGAELFIRFMVKKIIFVGGRLGWLTATNVSSITRTRATTAVIGERKVIPANACATEAVFCWIYIICLPIKWAKLGITLQRWNIMICVMHF